MICPLCEGSGRRFTNRYGRQWWPCHPCAATGTLAVSGPGAVAISRAQAKFLRALPLPTAPTPTTPIQED